MICTSISRVITQKFQCILYKLQFTIICTYSLSEIDIKIILNQTGTFGIGGNEHGLQYFVKANYTLKSSDGISDRIYTAYYLDYSLLKITSISTNSIEADFNMKLFKEDFSDSLLITSGRLNIDF